MRRIHLWSLPIFILLTSIAWGQWKTYTNTSEIRQMTVMDSVIWCATNGGMLKINADPLSTDQYTNTEGLAQIDVVAVAHDPRGYIWTAMPDGLLQILNLTTNEWDTYNEFQNRLVVSAFAPYNDYMLVGSDIGISELRLDAKNHWERTWKAEIGLIHEILIAQEHIWVAQTDGVRRIQVDYTNKQIPNAWQHFGIKDGFQSANVNALLEYGDFLVAGTQSGIIMYDGASWSSPQMLEHNVRDLVVWNEQICLASQRGVYVRDDFGTWNLLGNARTDALHLGVTHDQVLWLGTEADGVAVYSESEQWEPLPQNGPGSNVFSNLLVDDDGHLWATSSHKPNGGVYFFNGEHWTNFTNKTGLPHYDYRSLGKDSFGRIWAGSWGGGVSLFEKMTQDSIVVTNLGAMDGNLSGVAGGADYVVITGFEIDEQGYLWVLNYQAGNKEVLAIYDMDNSWQHWTTTEGIRSDKVIALEIDNVGRKWIGTDGNGVSVLDDAGTIFDKTDDDLSGFLDRTEGLESNFIHALAEDLDGTMWIGTSDGLNYWFSGSVGVRYSVINDNIQTIYVDPRNNKWIGTVGGLSVLDSDNFSWKHYTTSNSLVVSDFISCFAFNEETGDIYIGTTNGLSRLETPYTKPSKNLSYVTGYPNPFIVDPNQSRFYIDNLALNSSVTIFSADGYLVKTIPRSDILGARVSWDGTNDDGEYVGSGVYVYLVTTKEGESKSGKVAVVRP